MYVCMYVYADTQARTPAHPLARPPARTHARRHARTLVWCMVWSGRGGPGGGGGADACGEGRGRWSCSWRVGRCRGGGQTEKAGILRKPCASHKPYNVGRLPFFVTLTCTLNPTPNPKRRLNAGSKPKAEHKPSTLTNLYPKPSLSPCRLEALYL